MRRIRFGLLGLPVVLLGACYLWLAVEHGTMFLGDVIVHEDGHRSLKETIRYPRHFLREIPIALFYAVASVGAFLTYGPRRFARPVWIRSRRLAWLLGAVLVVWAVATVTLEHGFQIAQLDLLQAYLTDHDMRPGLHWRAHLLSSLMFLCWAIVLAALLGRIVDSDFSVPRSDSRWRWIGGGLVGLIGISLIYGLDSEILLDPRIAGHQAREAVTHLLITLSLGMGVLMAASSPPRHSVRSAPSESHHKPPREVVATAGLAVILISYLGIYSWVSGTIHMTRPGVSLSSLVAAHTFEHSLDYMLTMLLCLGLFLSFGHDSGS